jgi:arylformamidase
MRRSPESQARAFMHFTVWLTLVACCLTQAFAATRSVAASVPAPTLMKNIPYGGVTGDARRNFDLYLPAKSTAKPPLLIFVHGGFWLLPDDDYRIGASLAENLVEDGVAVALVRYRLAPAHRHPTQAQDVAAAVAHLVRNADKYGFDSQRIFLSGHSAGGHLASLVALDRSYLAEQKLAASIAGVISFSGLYDLQPAWNISDNQKSAVAETFGQDSAVLKRASPVAHVRRDAPRFLILSASSDFPGFAIDARRFADRLRAAGAGAVDQHMFKGADHFSLVKLDGENNPVRRTVLGFMGVRALPEPLSTIVEAKRRWSDPPYSTKPFWKYQQWIRSYPIDQRFTKMLEFIYRDRKEELQEWPLRQFHAIDLVAYLNAAPKAQIGEGDHIALTNVRGERQVWQRAEIERYKPVIVVGVDDERNLFRFGTLYRMFHEYSWKPGGPPPPLTMTLGAFIYFLETPPRELSAQSWHFGLTENSFHRVKDDPLRAIRDLPQDVHEAMTFRNGCVYCHSFRGTGARSHHVHALTGKPQGGFALPLEQYPAEVWKNFMFNQVEVARKMGATPNIVRESARQQVFELVNRERQRPAGK